MLRRLYPYVAEVLRSCLLTLSKHLFENVGVLFGLFHVGNDYVSVSLSPFLPLLIIAFVTLHGKSGLIVLRLL